MSRSPKKLHHEKMRQQGLVLEDRNDDEKTRILNGLKTEINSGVVKIEFKKAVRCSFIT
jgi:hypothetical protein